MTHTPHTRRRPFGALFALLLAVGLLVGCSSGSDDSSARGQADKQRAYEQQEKAVPFPGEQLTDSTERRNLEKRLLRSNDPNRQGYVYIMNYGKIVGYYAIKGKVSSLQSQMTPADLIRDPCSSSYCPMIVEAPSDDGSYGPNEDGVFFFTTNDVMVSTNLDYIESDAPLPIDVPRLDPQKK